MADRGALIAGIGVNVNQSTFPDDLAICHLLRIETGHEYSKEDLLDAIVAECLAHSDMEKGRNSAPLRQPSTLSAESRSKSTAIFAGLPRASMRTASSSSGPNKVWKL